jgi:hypothetical protein
MNLNAGEVLQPAFHFLDGIIQDYGVYLYLILVWLSLILIAWIMSGGLRRRQSRQNSTVIIPGIIVTVRPPVTPPPLPPCIGMEHDPVSDDHADNW